MYSKYFIYSAISFICTSFNVRKEKQVLLQINQTYSFKFRLIFKVKAGKWARPALLLSLTGAGNKALFPPTEAI